MMRFAPNAWRALLLAAALLFAQQGVALHGLHHAMHDAAVATLGKDHAPPLDHGKSDCVAFCAIGYAIDGWTLALAPVAARPPIFAPIPSGALLPLWVVFDPRAPPHSV